MPVQCHHCEDAPCLKACLPGAIRRVNNVVCVDARRCIGCRNCALACPFGAIEVISASLVETITAEFGKETLQTSDGAVKFVHKCDLCLESSSGPACVNVCPNKALRIVNTAVEIAQKRINALEAAPQNENFKECLKGGSL
ncbi:MAG: 4Fe-4S binding protein [Spirochaetaceae bacterium]|nr:4Fe-4S binding protein [Spirochaetaceae bacterium]